MHVSTTQTHCAHGTLVLAAGARTSAGLLSGPLGFTGPADLTQLDPGHLNENYGAHSGALRHRDPNLQDILRLCPRAPPPPPPQPSPGETLQRTDSLGSVTSSSSPLGPETPAGGNVPQSTFSQGQPAAMHMPRYEPHKQPSGGRQLQASGKAMISAVLAQAGLSSSQSGKVSYLLR